MSAFLNTLNLAALTQLPKVRDADLNVFSDFDSACQDCDTLEIPPSADLAGDSIRTTSLLGIAPVNGGSADLAGDSIRATPLLGIAPVNGGNFLDEPFSATTTDVLPISNRNVEPVFGFQPILNTLELAQIVPPEGNSEFSTSGSPTLTSIVDALFGLPALTDDSRFNPSIFAGQDFAPRVSDSLLWAIIAGISFGFGAI